MSVLLQDVRYALRQLRRTPGFTAAAVLTLALGIGGTAATLSIASGLFHRTIPVPEAERVVGVVQHWAAGDAYPAVSYPEFLAYREGGEAVFETLAAIGIRTFGLRTEAGAEPVAVALVSGDYFSMLGVRPLHGRFIEPGDDAAGSTPVAVLSHEAWQERFGGDPAVIGRTIHLGGHSLTVIGVASKAFRGTQMTATPEVWVPIAARTVLAPHLMDRPDARIIWLTMQGRLREGVTRQQAEAALAVAGRNVSASLVEEQRVERITLISAGGLPPVLRGTVASVTGILLVASGLVFLIAATNVAGMLLARATARRRETAIRLAIGAGRPRLVRQALTESGVLFLIGGSAGMLVALALTRIAEHFVFTERGPIPLTNLEVSPDPAILVLAFLLALTAGLASGLAPAMEGARTNLTPALKDASAGGGRHRSTLRSAMVVGQVAMSLVLLVGAGLFVRSIQEAARVDLGLDPGEVTVGRLALQPHGYDRQGGLNLYRELAERLEALPSVRRVSFADAHPLASMEVITSLSVGGGEAVQLWYNPVSEGYFAALDIPLLQGRLFDRRDRAGAREVAVVNQSFATRFLPDGQAVGTTVSMGGREVEIVGVVRDSRWSGLEDESRPFAYRPLEQDYIGTVSMLVRASGEQAALEAAIRREMHALNPDLPLLGATTLERQIRQLTLPQRAAAWAAGAFGAVGLLLALVGLYGLLAYTVGQRRREIGVRMALGASAAAVVRLARRQGVALVGIGLALGLAVSAALQPALRNLLFGVSPFDPLTLGAVTGLLLTVALLAAWLPARRAARVDPMIALRAE